MLATFQVTVAVPVPPRVIPDRAGRLAGTWNGPAALLTVRATSRLSEVPPPAVLSRAVRRNVSVRFVVGRISPTFEVPASRFEKRGTVRTGLAVGVNERMIGPVPGSTLMLTVAGPRSYCSPAVGQCRVRRGALVAAPVSTNGVLAGIVYGVSAATTGAAWLAALAEQLLPEPLVVKLPISCRLRAWK